MREVRAGFLTARGCGTGLFVAVVACLVGLPSTSWSQSADAIAQSLKPKTGLTRSLVPHSSLDDGDAAFVRDLPTRGIRIEERARLAEIVKKNDLPRIDLTIGFDYDSDVIRPSSIPVVVELGKALVASPLASARVLLNGHTDAAGDDGYNVTLSERRARSVKTFLKEHFGIGDDRLMAVGYGKERLKNHSDPLSADNRRVEVVNLGTN